MTPSRIASGVLLMAFLVSPAAAEDPLGIWLSREDAAQLASQAAKVPALQDQIKTLEAEASELRAGRDAALKLVEVTEKVAAAQDRLRQLAEEERNAYRAAKERAEKDRGQGRLWLTVQARAAQGALLGMPFGFPVGPVAGAILGGIAGAIETWGP